MHRISSTKRWHPLLGEWVIIAPVTAGRPWSGSVVKQSTVALPEFDPECYLCPGVQRAGGAINPDYTGTHIFDNDFPSLSMELAVSGCDNIRPFDSAAQGICRVVCFSPKHNITLPEIEPEEFTGIIHALSGQFAELSAIPEIRNVMVFENRGKVIGVSNAHTNGQIYSTDFVPRIPLTMSKNARTHKHETGTCLFCTVLETELTDGSRIVSENDDFAAYVPYFASHAYEIHIIPRRHVSYMTELTVEEQASLSKIYREIMIRYDNLFKKPMPNITVFYNAPCGGEIDPEPFHFHIEFYPPLRSPDKLKYMAGFESGGGNIINPSLPEESAKFLRNVPTIHYLNMN